MFASLGYVGTLVAPMFGVVGDRIGHRDLLAMMRATYAVLAATLMTLALTGHLTPLFVFVVAALMGLVRPSDLGVRGALVADHHAARPVDRRDQHLAHHAWIPRASPAR